MLKQSNKQCGDGTDDVTGRYMNHGSWFVCKHKLWTHKLICYVNLIWINYHIKYDSKTSLYK